MLLPRRLRQPSPPPSYPPWYPPKFDEPAPRSFPIGPLAIGDAWETAQLFTLWGANKLSIEAQNYAVYVQFSRTQAPEPPVWDPPVYVPLGPYSHTGPFGAVRFRNVNVGQVATVIGTIFSE